MAAQDNIWGIKDTAAIIILQRIWDFIYGANIPLVIKISGPVFSIVSSFIAALSLTLLYFAPQANQHLCKFRSSFGSAALMALNMYFEKQELNTDEERGEFAEEALNGYTFLFGEVYEDLHGDVSVTIISFYVTKSF
jgi:hypothetical protein